MTSWVPPQLRRISHLRYPACRQVPQGSFLSCQNPSRGSSLGCGSGLLVHCVPPKCRGHLLNPERGPVEAAISVYEERGKHTSCLFWGGDIWSIAHGLLQNANSLSCQWRRGQGHKTRVCAPFPNFEMAGGLFYWVPSQHPNKIVPSSHNTI